MQREIWASAALRVSYEERKTDVGQLLQHIFNYNKHIHIAVLIVLLSNVRGPEFLDDYILICLPHNKKVGNDRISYLFKTWGEGVLI